MEPSRREAQSTGVNAKLLVSIRTTQEKSKSHLAVYCSLLADTFRTGFL